ncbi:helix-turn-helix domain-containing protein [Streptosporangium sp. NPDC001559]|uniref:helix-turn-helix domain-containing protein n=1 Tax=Streptosporangium sp. NPDC001559 TaxID=3366187 RepID=UPI0036F106DA
MKTRRARRLNQSRAAEQIGVSIAMISRIEAGEGLHVASVLPILRWLDTGGNSRG